MNMYTYENAQVEIHTSRGHMVLDNVTQINLDRKANLLELSGVGAEFQYPLSEIDYVTKQEPGDDYAVVVYDFEEEW